MTLKQAPLRARSVAQSDPRSGGSLRARRSRRRARRIAVAIVSALVITGGVGSLFAGRCCATAADLPTLARTLSPSAETGLLAIAALWVVVLPGIAAALWLRRPAADGAVWVLAAGLGLALAPVIYLLASQIGFPVSRTTIAVYGSIASLAIAARWWGTSRVSAHQGDAGRTHVRWWALGLLAICLIVFVAHWSHLQGFAVPPGIDTGQHVLIEASFHGAEGIPDDYQPLSDLQSFTYHFGSHAATAMIATLSGVPSHRAHGFTSTLLLGIAIGAVGVLALTMTGRRDGALLAAAVVAAVGPFPATYLDWGRIPQLAGVTLLALVLSEFIHGIREGLGSRAVVTVPLLTAGLLLSHYKIAVILAFAVACLVLSGVAFDGDRRDRLRRTFGAGILLGAGVLLIAPWVVRLLRSFQFDQATQSTTSSVRPPGYFFSIERLFDSARPSAVLVSAVVFTLGLVFAWIVKRRVAVFLVSWVAIMLVFSNPYLVPLPGAGLVDFVTVVSILYIPGAIAVAFLTTSTGRRPLSTRSRVLLVGVLLFAAAGWASTGSLIRDTSIYVRAAEIKAFEWIRENVPEDARFLTGMRVSKIGIVEPTDAGSWIPYFTGRTQTAPLLIYRAEELPFPDYEARKQELVTLERNLGKAGAADTLRARGVTHVFYHPRTKGEMSLKQLRRAAWLKAVYEDDGVWIFQLD